MYPLNDNDLDRLSREAAEHYDVESSATGWEALENRLDRELPHKEDKDRRRFLFWLVFIAAITGGTLFWMLNNNTPAKDSIAQNKGQNKIVSSTATQDDKTSNDKVSEDNTSINKTAAEQETTITDNTKKSSITPGSNNIQDNSTVAPSGVVAGRNKGSVVRSGRKGKLKPVADPDKDSEGMSDPSNKSAKDKGIAKQQDDLNNKADDKDANAAATKDAAQPVAVAPIATDKSADKAADKSKDDVKPSTEEAPTPKKAPITAKKSIKGFELGLVGGPDLTNIKFKYFDRAGYIAGLQIGYRFNNRWSVNTGLFYTKKNYVAAAEDFNPPKHYWTTYVNLDKIDGNCSMWEVPLNVRYDFSTGKKQSWFASTGLSTYFMTHQEYEYYYFNQVGALTRSKKLPNDSTFNHLFSILNLSAGYERSIGKGFSIQAEPYFKVPLKGLGFGELKMESYGVLFSLRYRIGQK